MSFDQPLVLLPGLLCDDAVWTPVLEHIDHRSNCVIPDYELLDDLGAMADYVLDNVEEEQFVLIGHSMGGRIAMEMVRRAPKRISHLGLFDTAYHSLAEGEAGEKEKQKRMALLEKATQEGMRVMGQQWALGMVHPQFHHSQLFESILDMIERKSPEIFAAQIKALLNRPDTESVLRSVTCSTLLLCGADDLWSPVTGHEKMNELIPHASLSVIPQCAHMSTMEQPAAVAESIMNWLSN